ncbi:helicase-exonuclease AddAB subunit AddB [Cohnella sp. JJ-181]|uniref:helicase-exonuclease AddAB subunit AddB n=1 Tax=Cohnella rhizoplanae TaxID=2974897 RepID=UPI0022FF60FB|nr:helicase-exonuclease AddAB subunit AddB [Cohnella sp. JJ-181]CAI6017951.1 ATP-dependent helicase/deoxyribonuclease subunit B [Cohnella sp. JJ-181]
MKLRLIAGRSGSGKSHLIKREIAERIAQDPAGPPLLLIVPEQATFQTEYALAATPGLRGFMRLQVLSFRRLAFRVMQETGGSAVVPIGDNGRSMLIHKALVRRQAELKLYRSGAGGAGLAERIGDLLTEWKRYGAKPDALRSVPLAGRDGLPNFPGTVGGRTAQEQAAAAAEGLLSDKLHDLTLLYEDVERELVGHYLDGEDALGFLVNGAPSSPLLEGAEIWLDGFHGFTPMEYAVIDALLRRCSRVSAALCLDRPYGAGESPDELDLFYQTADTSSRLCQAAEAAGAELEPAVLLRPETPPRFAACPMLAHLERAMDGRTRWAGSEAMLQPAHPRCGMSIHEAVSRRAEAEAVARDMLRRVREGSARWRDMSVFARNLDSYGDLLASVFDDYGIPYFLDGRVRASHHPLVEFVRSALECVIGGWRYEAFFRCAKTDLLHPQGSSVSREAVDALENYVLAAGIDGWRWHDDRSWYSLSGRDLDAEEDLDESEGSRSPSMQAIRATRDGLLSPLRTLESRFKRAKTQADLSRALFLLLEETAAPDRLELWSRQDDLGGDPLRARMHRQLWDGAIGLLDELVELMGDEPADAALFAGMLDAGLESIRLGVVPPSLDRVLIGTPERTRTDRVSVLYLLGVNEGILPMAIKDDGLLSEDERTKLAESGIGMAPNARRRLLDEEFLAYLALTTPSNHLWIGYALADEEGQSLIKSSLVGRIRSWFPGIPVSAETSEPQPGSPDEAQLSFAVRPGRALTHTVAMLRRHRQGDALAPGWKSVYRWLSERETWRSRLSVLLSSLRFSNEERPLRAQTSLLLYGDRLLASVSRMERFVACPFRHYAAHGLRLKERRMYRVAAPDIGQLFHAALRQTTEKLLMGDPAAGDMGLWHSEAAAAVERLLPRVQSQILLSSNRHRTMARKLSRIVSQTSAMLGEHAALSAFRPVGLEVDFGPQGIMPPLSLYLGDGRWMDVAGRIDRVDAAESRDGTLLRILDYKSSAVKLRLDEVAHGLSLQMLTYLDVVVTHAPHWLGRPAKPAGVLYLHVHNPLLHTANGLDETGAEEAIRKEYRMEGLVLADGEAVKLMDESLESSSKSSVVPVEYKKDGTFAARSQVADGAQWETLRKAVRRNISKIGKRIVDGDVDIAPYRLGKKSPCTVCEFRPVCQFDGQLEGNRHHALRRPANKDEVWEWLGESDEEGGDEEK